MPLSLSLYHVMDLQTNFEHYFDWNYDLFTLIMLFHRLPSSACHVHHMPSFFKSRSWNWIIWRNGTYQIVLPHYSILLKFEQRSHWSKHCKYYQEYQSNNSLLFLAAFYQSLIMKLHLQVAFVAQLYLLMLVYHLPYVLVSFFNIW